MPEEEQLEMHRTIKVRKRKCKIMGYRDIRHRHKSDEDHVEITPLLKRMVWQRQRMGKTGGNKVSGIRFFFVPYLYGHVEF